MADETKQSAGQGTKWSECPGPILLLGAPAVGKGTQAKELMRIWKIPQISTGDILRSNVALGTDLGRIAKGLMDRGDLVPDYLINEMVNERLRKPDTTRGFILDGYPRTLPQAEWFDGRLAAQAAAKAQEHCAGLVAVSIQLDYNKLLLRVTGRRNCPVCHRIYNIYGLPPKRKGICDVEGEPLFTRADDSVEAFENRMRAYNELTAPVIEHYRRIGSFVEIDGGAPVEIVTKEIVGAVYSIRSQTAAR
jgi:adenylate kinase